MDNAQVTQEAREARIEHLRAEIERCDKAIAEGAADNWWHIDRDRFRQEIDNLTEPRHRLERSEPVVDSGFGADNLAVAEWFWANMPTGSRKWTSLPTHEKALVCHTVQRLQGATTPPEPVAEIERLRDNANVDRAIMASVKLGAWLSAALDDPDVCDAMKADIREWFSAGEPMSAIHAALGDAS